MTAQVIPFPLVPPHLGGPVCPISAGDISGLLAHARRVVRAVQADAQAYGDHAMYAAADDALASVEMLGDMLLDERAGAAL